MKKKIYIVYYIDFSTGGVPVDKEQVVEAMNFIEACDKVEAMNSSCLLTDVTLLV